MAIPEIDKKYIYEALKYIDENGVPDEHASTKYDLVTEEGKKYPPKYVVAVARHLAYGVEISTNFHPNESKKILLRLGFTIEKRPRKTETDDQEENVHLSELERFSSMLRNSKNIIFHGAPGTGKTYLAREIAAYIISNGQCTRYDDLSDEQKQQMEFVQFHPSYDYTDFVEGLRPTVNDDGTMGFELQDGIFKKFVVIARKNDEDSQKSVEKLENEASVQESMDEFFLSIELGIDKFKTVLGKEFTIKSVDDKYIVVSNPKNKKYGEIKLTIESLRRMFESGRDFTSVQEVAIFFGRIKQIHADSYYFALFQEIREIMKKKGSSATGVKPTERKDYIFIIDEINRGEISKIFGELFFAIDPGYRGKDGSVSTQYANMHPDEEFYIPENVYIIGTMNDIDRSVDSFDFAMRRRFRFVELKAGDRVGMLDSLEDNALIEEARKRMTALNGVISEHLNDNYQIGPSYFLKLDELDFDQLWTDYLQPLLHDYIQGMPDEKGIMEQFEEAYGYKKPTEDDANGAAKD